VVDVTVPEAHVDVTLAALERRIPVLGEKPMASNMEEARRMVAKSQETGTLYMVSQSRRYNPQIQAFRRLVQRLGQLGILNADFYLGPHFGGFRDEMDSVLMLDMAIHTMDQARFLSGADPISVYCEEFNTSWSWYKGASSATAIFQMANGLRFTYRGSWCAEGRNTSWESEWRAVGEKGSGIWDGFNAVNGELAKPTGGFIQEVDSIEESIQDDPHQGIAGSLRDFLKALEDPSHVPQGRCDDNIKSLAMVFGAVESARKNERVKIDT
jgi:predicted dehydrogenase